MLLIHSLRPGEEYWNMAEAGVAAPMFKKKGGGKRDVRARDSAVDSAVAEGSSASTARETEEEASNVVLKKRKLGMAGPRNPLVQASGLGLSKKSKREWEDDEDEDLKLDRYGESSVSSVVRSNGEGSSVLDNRGDATRESDWYDESQSGSTTAPSGANNDDGVYRGTSSYNTFITTRDDGVSAKLKAATKGPVKGGNNVRTITVVDYQPDVCKDYKETGYCGFGDTCKFMHDRTDYLAGWQMDALPNSSARRGGGDDSDDAVEEEEIPFACLICRNPFTDPILTKCGHYFCSACAIKRFSKTSKCFACGKQTQGIFNSASKVLDRMEKAKKAREDVKEQKRWNRGATTADDDDENVQQSGELIDGVEIGGQEGDE
jgi:RING finger protein 113A